LQALKILIAEDHEDFLQLLTQWLGRKFEIVGAVKDGRYLVDGALSLKPDVIVSDVMMPALTGVQALRELEARGCCVPFVFLTSDAGSLRGMGSIVDKLDARSELEAAIRAAASGQMYVSRRTRLNQGPPPRKAGKE
jgi:DNA-binding NarL/FixJ family response regulator